MAEQDVEPDAREGRAAGVDPGAVDVHLHQDLRLVVADLRAEHADRMAGRGLARRDQLPVGGVRLAADLLDAGGADRARPS